MTLPFEFPDPVVTAYMEHVARLSAGDRKLLDLVVRDGHPLLFPWVWAHNLRARFTCAQLLRRSVAGCRDAVARARYGAFYRQLFLDEWKWGAAGRVAVGLLAVRMRTQTGARLFDQAMGQVLSRMVIGWRDGDTRPDPIAASSASA